MSKFLKSAITAAAMLASFAASADTTTLVSMEVLPGNHFVGFTVNGGPITNFAIAGEIQAETADGKSFAAYCIDALTDLGVAPSSYQISQVAMDSVARLFAVSGFNGTSFATDGVDTAFKQSGLQLAIWEAVYENGDLTGDFTSGLFQATHVDVSDPAAVAFSVASFQEATNYLSAAASYTGSYHPDVLQLTSLSDPSRQTLVTSIPEPSTYALMAACLGVVGFVARRKHNA